MKQLRSVAAVLLAAVPILVLVALCGGCVAIIFALNSFGHEWAVGAMVIAVLAWLVLGPRLLRSPGNGSSPGRQSPVRRILGYARVSLGALLGCWLGLIGWSKLSRGGPIPTPKTDPSSIRVVTWNILRGQEDSPLWNRFDWSNWSGRADALQAAVHQAEPDILCVQEALPQQVAFLEQTLPTHRRVGVGRDDGRSAGEHCAIFFDRDRFEEIGGDTFWLEEPTDQPPGGSVLKVKRICTWVRLRDRVSGQTLRVYNLHSYLSEKARLPAARVILDHIAAGEPADAIIVAGDFNAAPDAASRRLFIEAGLANSAELAGSPADTPTYHWYGLRLRCLDAILVSPGWQVREHRIIDVKPNGTFPSDHFGVLADLAVRNP
jgi:endonuclease/exonuclease/phosphatase family metal-dependent hydrolase